MTTMAAMREAHSTARVRRLDSNPKGDDIQICTITSSAGVSGIRAVQILFLLGFTACLVFLCSCNLLPETPKGAARSIPPETPLNREAGNFGLILLPITM